MEDLFDVQDEIARAITERLKVTLSGGVKRTTENPEAYELYLKGRHYWHQRSPAAVRLAIQCFEDAIKLDPRHALAYAGLADCYGILRSYGWMSPEDARPPAQAAVMQAMTLAPSMWEVNFARGFYVLYFERVWREAEPYFPEGYRHLAYLQTRADFKVKPDMPGRDGPELAALYARGARWLKGEAL